MVWGLKTSVDTGVSASARNKMKTRFLGTACLGILFVFCAPGQITKADYSSSIKVAEHQIVPVETPMFKPVSVSVEKQHNSLRGKTKITLTKSEIVSIKKAPKPGKIVKLASLDASLPEITKPRDYIPNPQITPPALPPVLRSTPKLEKKLFGSVELKFQDERKIRAWSGVYERFLADVTGIKSCLNVGCTDPMLADWANELRPFRNLSKFQKIEAVNILVNRRRYADDRRNYGRSDYWASPREFLAKGGDCEDYAILKFASLLALGVNDQDMRLVVGRLASGTPHAFLATRVAGQEYILDNRQPQVYLTTNRKDYVPKYSMNLSYRWSHVMPGATTT